MKTFLAVLLLVAATNAVWKGGLRVTWGVGLNIGTDFFYEIPKTIDEVNTEGWDAVQQPDGLPHPSLDMYCSDDRILCGFFDGTNYVAGLQIGIPVDQIENAPYDFERLGYHLWETDVDGVTTQFYTIQQYFVSEETLEKSVEERLAAWDTSVTLQESSIWVNSFNGTLLEIPTVADDIANGEDFTKQACVPWMGRHYYYKMDANTACSADTLLSWFPIVESGELIATGFNGFFGLKNTYQWFEDPSRTAVEYIVSDGPECLYELADSPGIVTLHIFYVNEPWLISCLFQ